MEGLGGIFSGIVATWLLYGIGAKSLEAGMIGFILRLLNYFSKEILAWVRMSNDLEVQANRSDLPLFEPSNNTESILRRSAWKECNPS